MSLTFPQKILSLLCFFYSFLFLFWFLLRWQIFDQYWPLAIINTTIFYFFIPLPILIIVAAVGRLKWPLVSLLFPTCIFIFFWGSLFLPTPVNSIQSPEVQKLTAMSFNVLSSNKTPEETVSSIISASPDLIGLQEISPRMIKAIKAEATDELPYHTFDMFKPSGVGLLSRYPIVSAEKFYFPPRDRLALHAIIDWQGQPVHVFVVHFSSNNFINNPLDQLPHLVRERYSERTHQMTSLLEKLDKIQEPVILMCDCNFTDTSEVYSRLSMNLYDSYRSAGWGFGHTLQPRGFSFPVQRIDYVWHSHDFEAITSYVGERGGSDHHSVISNLKYNGDG